MYCNILIFSREGKYRLKYEHTTLGTWKECDSISAVHSSGEVWFKNRTCSIWSHVRYLGPGPFSKSFIIWRYLYALLRFRASLQQAYMYCEISPWCNEICIQLLKAYFNISSSKSWSSILSGSRSALLFCFSSISCPKPVYIWFSPSCLL